MNYINDKLTVVWICHFLNKSVSEKLSLNAHEQEYAPWITLWINEFKRIKNIDLHVISPFIKIARSKSFSEGNIHYHCIKVGIPFLKREWPIWFNIDYWINFTPFNLKTKRLIRLLRPDIINLIGAENAYYSSSVLGIRDYPVLVTIQGFLTLNKVENSRDPVIRKRIKVEEAIMKHMKYFGIEARSIEKHIRSYNPDAVMYWFHFPFRKTEVKGNPQKEYDLVFFARVVRMKGIEDLFRALAEVKNHKPDVSLEIIGSGEETYLSFLRELAEELGIVKNIAFRGFIPTQQEMHFEAMKARISVLPTYNDTLPGTIIESMLLGLPVISYRTGGIPDLNISDENIILVEQGNIKELANEIVKLLDDPQRQRILGEKVKSFAAIEFDNKKSTDLLIKAYGKVIRDYRRLPE